jgi:hypothetical protein
VDYILRIHCIFSLQSNGFSFCVWVFKLSMHQRFYKTKYLPNGISSQASHASVFHFQMWLCTFECFW